MLVTCLMVLACVMVLTLFVVPITEVDFNAGDRILFPEISKKHLLVLISTLCEHVRCLRAESFVQLDLEDKLRRVSLMSAYQEPAWETRRPAK